MRTERSFGWMKRSRPIRHASGQPINTSQASVRLRLINNLYATGSTRRRGQKPRPRLHCPRTLCEKRRRGIGKLEHFSARLHKERARRQYEQYGKREVTQCKSLKNALDAAAILIRPCINFNLVANIAEDRDLNFKTARQFG